jgi:hypothetical protein
MDIYCGQRNFAGHFDLLAATCEEPAFLAD